MVGGGQGWGTRWEDAAVEQSLRGGTRCREVTTEGSSWTLDVVPGVCRPCWLLRQKERSILGRSRVLEEWGEFPII